MVEAAFYGDDFTGSTDALLQFARCGLRGVLLVDLPPIDELHALATRYDVIGVAGIARSLPPDEQEAELRPVLTALRDLNPRVVQYKICSTADSAPGLGSIGRALEVGRSLFGPAPVPILAAQPDLGRYTVFSHHFAAETGTVHRLDRQPTMANHPATPMRESDLRRHLAGQTQLCITGLHLTAYDHLAASHLQSTADAVVLDALTDADLRLLGRTIVARSNVDAPAFTIGSGGLSRALALALTRFSPPSSPTEPSPPSNPVQPSAPPAPIQASPLRTSSPEEPERIPQSAALYPDAPPATSPFVHSQVLVVSGSQSARTRQQIEHATTSGWLAVNVQDGAAVRQAIAALHNGFPGVVVHTGQVIEHSSTGALVDSLGEALAAAARAILQRTDVRRVIIAGGDTSGRVVRHLGVSSLELLRPSNDLDPSPPHPHDLGPGAALCRATAPDSSIDGLHILLKGGQIGAPNLFEAFRTTPTTN